MSDRIYNRVETNDSTPDNNRPSFCHRHWKKAIISLILFIVAGVVVVAVVVTQTTNNSTSPTTFSKLTDENASNKCLYYTPENIVTKMKLKDDPFEGLCDIDSVNKTCNIDKHESSSHLCEKCTDGSLLPSFCFCDKKVHCVNDKKYGGRAADDSKKTCNWCADVFINQFNHRGNASCSRASQAVVNTTCEGYDGFMCSFIKTRVCTLTDKRQNLKPCSRSNLKKCFMKSKRSGKYYHCQNFMDSNVEERKDLKTCNLDATP
ncbi:Hypothetical predicted protein [Mytilus galloprovincialis]|uniref:Uncharacterized protein n=1 Tax=Mytilus galloprovincialis TaxID=29158 RepID=A0A8B6CJH5_MYTGA|nr:Hypothetical predicted protein [Mytilus galloprovincialis]